MSYSELTNAIGHCIGYGQMDAEYYFFGLEEKSQTESVDYSNLYLEHHDIAKGFYAIPNDKFTEEPNDNNNTSRLYNIYLRLYNELTKNNIDIREFLSDKTPILIGNLEPFSKDKNASNYTNEEQEWLNENMQRRRNFLLKFLIDKSMQNKKVFMFGKRDERKKMFEEFVKSSNLDMQFDLPIRFVSSPTYYYVKSSNGNLFLLNHPSRPINLSKANLDEIVKSFR